MFLQQIHICARNQLVIGDPQGSQKILRDRYSICRWFDFSENDFEFEEVAKALDPIQVNTRSTDDK